jgi:CHAT domain-containing protein
MIRLFKTRQDRPGTSMTQIYRAAQVRIIDEATSGGPGEISFAHPIFWAPFSLVGDGA